jgi:hypothetical protein
LFIQFLKAFAPPSIQVAAAAPVPPAMREIWRGHGCVNDSLIGDADAG